MSGGVRPGTPRELGAFVGLVATGGPSWTFELVPTVS